MTVDRRRRRMLNGVQDDHALSRVLRPGGECRLLTFDGWRVIEDVADGDDVHLPAEAFVRSVDADRASIASGAGVNIDAVVGHLLGGVLEPGQWDKEPTGAVIEDDVLKAFERVGVEQEPLAAGENGGIEIDAADIGDAMRFG